MKYSLKNAPKICHGNIDYLDEDTECQKWFEGFEAELREMDVNKWFDENIFEEWTWESMLQKFIEREILGE